MIWLSHFSGGGSVDFLGRNNCVHGFSIGGAPFHTDRILWLAKNTSSSLSSFLVQLFRVVLMKLNYESENYKYKLKSYESKERESKSYKSKSHESKGISIIFFLFFPPTNAFKVEKTLLSQRGASSTSLLSCSFAMFS